MLSMAKCVDFSHTLIMCLHKKKYKALKWFESTYQSVLSCHVTLRECCEYFVTFECVCTRDIWGNKNICHVIIRKRCSNPIDFFFVFGFFITEVLSQFTATLSFLLYRNIGFLLFINILSRHTLYIIYTFKFCIREVINIT